MPTKFVHEISTIHRYVFNIDVYYEQGVDQLNIATAKCKIENRDTVNELRYSELINNQAFYMSYFVLLHCFDEDRHCAIDACLGRDHI